MVWCQVGTDDWLLFDLVTFPKSPALGAVHESQDEYGSGRSGMAVQAGGCTRANAAAGGAEASGEPPPSSRAVVVDPEPKVLYELIRLTFVQHGLVPTTSYCAVCGESWPCEPVRLAFRLREGF